MWAAWAAPKASAQTADPQLIAVSADIVEISGSLSKQEGFTWGPFQTGINFAEKSPIPGILKIGDFARQTALQASLQMLETEGKAQMISNPKVIVESGQQANFMDGGENPYPVTNNQGVGVEFKKVATILNIVPQVIPDKKDLIRAEFQLEVSNADFSHPVTVGGTTVPAVVTRQLQSAVDVKSGETLVIGGLKSSTKNISRTKVPFLGSIPILGLLFTNVNVSEQETTLFLFITMEIIK